MAVVEQVSSRITIGETPPGIRRLSTSPTAITVMLGVTERGPINVPTKVTDFDEYKKDFGGFVAASSVAQSALGFFQNGGSELWVVRTTHFTDITDAGTALGTKATNSLTTGSGATAAVLTGTAPGPWDLTPADTLIIDVDAGGNATATFDATPATITSGSAETYALANGETLTVEIDGGVTQTALFETADFVGIGVATALEVAAVINTDIAGAFADGSSGSVIITSDKKGTGASVEVTGGTGNGVLGFSTTLVAGTGDVADIDAVTFAEVKTVVEADIAGIVLTEGGSGELVITTVATGAAASINVDATSTTEVIFGLSTTLVAGTASGVTPVITVNGKTEGTYGDGVRTDVQDATSGVATLFDLVVFEDGVFAKRFPNLSMTPADTNFHETVINNTLTGSDLIATVDLAVGSRPTNQSVTLAGGDDGLTGLVDADFLGNESGETGLHALANITDFSLIAIPGRVSAAVHQGLLDFCETTREGKVFAVMAGTAGLGAVAISAYVQTTADLVNRSEFGAFYWPHVKVVNPDKTVFGADDLLVVTPEGYLMGMYARVDAARTGGVYTPPAGTGVARLIGVLGVDSEEVFNRKKRDLVAARLINPIRKDTFFYADGVDTLKADLNFPTVAERRGVIFIKRTLDTGLDIYRFRNNDERLRKEVDRTITSFLTAQMNLGAFRTTDPNTAFSVEVKATAQDIFEGRLRAKVTLATQKPTKFIDILLSQDVRALQESL